MSQHSSDLITSARRVIKQQAVNIEFQVDQLADGVHKLLQYQEKTDQLAGQVLEDAEAALAISERRIREKSGTEKLPMKEVLKSLAGGLLRNPQSAVGE
jgi:kinetochore protein Mis13/DSN1